MFFLRLGRHFGGNFTASILLWTKSTEVCRDLEELDLHSKNS